MAHITACPENENSTDCLLRVLLKIINDKIEADDGKFDWNPITFGFTVPIGLLAAIFALVTILQAILSAGPGRRRCNEVAIGRWSELTTRRWSWHDLMFLSTAKTPLLRADSILEILRDDKNSQDNSRNLKKSSKNQPLNSTSAATWLNFLQEIGLEDLYTSDKDILKETAADYLPSDSLAVPAYGEVGFIVSMAAAAGAHSWKVDSTSPYPIIIGEDFQFDFRQHPTLGTVGAFSRYVNSKENRSPCSKKHLVKAIQHAKGEIDITTLFPLDVSDRQSSSQKSPVSKNIVKLLNSEDLILKTHRYDECNRREKKGSICRILPALVEQKDENLLWLFIADTPERPPVVFPSGLIYDANLLSILALNSKFWSTWHRAWVDPSAVLTLHELPSLPYVKCWHPFSEKQEVLLPDVKLADRQILGYSDIYQACIKLLYEPESFQAWFDSHTRSEKQTFRKGVVAQLQQIDVWLQYPGHEQEVRCSIFSLYRITNALLRAEKAIAVGVSGGYLPAGQANAQPTNPGDNYSKDDTTSYSDPENKYLQIIPTRHFPMLKIFRKLIDECLLSEDLEIPALPADHREKVVENFKKNFKKNIKILSTLLGIAPGHISSPLYIPSIAAFLKIIGELVKTWENTEREDQPKHYDLGNTQANEDQLKHSDEENTQDILIWRCILMAFLFWTAPDNSNILLSGLWEHVIPII